MSKLDEIRQGVEEFFEERGINPLAGTAFVLLVIAAVAFVLLAPRPTEFKAIVLSSGVGVEGATVEVLSQKGELLATGVTNDNGAIVFTKGKLPSSGTLTLKASKQGFAGPNGERYAYSTLELGKGKRASLELFSSEVRPGDFSGGISFTVLDKLSQQPVPSASLNVVSGSQSFALTTDERGKAVLATGLGQTIRMKLSAAGYYSDSRAFTAIRGEETIFLSPRISEEVSLSSPGELYPQIGEPAVIPTSTSGVVEEASTGPVKLSMPEGKLSVADAQGTPVSTGTVKLVSAGGQVLATTPITNGFATLPKLSLAEGFSVVVEGAGSSGASIKVFDAISNTQLLSKTADENGKASLSLVAHSTLAVSVRTPGGEPVPTGTLRVHDSATNALLREVGVAGGFALVDGVQANTRIKLVFSATGYSSSPSEVVFGQTASATVVATSVGLQNFRDTLLRAQGETGPVSARARIFKQADSTPVFEGDLTGSRSVSLQSGAAYSIVFSSPGRYSHTFSSVQAGSTVDAVLPLAGASATVNECVTLDGVQSCSSQPFVPANLFELTVSVVQQNGAALANAVVSVRDSAGRTLFAERTLANGEISFAGLAAGSYAVSATASGGSSSRSIALVGNSRETISLSLTATLFVSATRTDGTPLSASFSVSGGPSCTGSSCGLVVAANSEQRLTVSSPGFNSVEVRKTVGAGETMPVTVQLVSAGSQLGINFLGFEDSLGNPVTSLLPGVDYRAMFSASSAANFDETLIHVRVGDKSTVQQDVGGIVASQTPTGFDFSYGYTSNSQPNPPAVCVDVNNNNPFEGKLKSLVLSVQNRGGPVQRIFSVPVRVSSNPGASELVLYYRIQGERSPAFIARLPEDSRLGNNKNAGPVADCYAASLSARIPIAFTAGCVDGTQRDRCSSLNPPLACQASSSNTGLKLTPADGCCAPGTTLNPTTGLCVVGVSQAGRCVDDTLEGQCSEVNKPYLCLNGQLVPAVSCRAAGTVFETYSSRSISRPRGVDCTVGLRNYGDGQCVSEEWLCSNGVLARDPVACGCPDGKVLRGSSCVLASCSDGTPIGQCSRSPDNFLKKCVASSSPQNELASSPDCSCPAGTQLVAGACQTCSTPDCGQTANTCSFNGVRYNLGCVANTQFQCTPNGIFSNPSACGCPAGKEFNSASNSCVAVSTPTCLGGIQVGQCSAQKPLLCVSTGAALGFAPQAQVCGCPSDKPFSDGVGCRAAVVVEPGQPPVVPPSNSCNCPNLVNLVCGANGNNYANDCQAQCAGVPVAHAGACSTTPTPTPSPTVQTCSPVGACLSPDRSSSYCAPQKTPAPGTTAGQGVLVQSCLICNQLCLGPNGGKNPLIGCSSASGLCEELKCQNGVRVETCDARNPPFRCTLSVNGLPFYEKRLDVCVCAAGKKPNADKSECVACTQPNCEGETEKICQTPDSQWHKAGCMPPQYSSSSEPIKFCVDDNQPELGNSGTILADLRAIATCGCREGFVRNADNSRCVPRVDSGGASIDLPPEATCPGCVNSDTVYFNSASGQLETVSKQTQFKLQVDDIYPKDAMRVRVNAVSASPFGIEVENIDSPAQTTPCYSYDVNSGLLALNRIGESDCPLKVFANSLYHAGLKQVVDSDEITINLIMRSLPPKRLTLKVRTDFRSLGSIKSLPYDVEGAETAQLVYIVDNKQLGGRLLEVSAQSVANRQLGGPGVLALAWRGPGQLLINDGKPVVEDGLPVSTHSYTKKASYFLCKDPIGGKRIEQCAPDDPDCCSLGWCTKKAAEQAISSFENAASNIAQQSVSRRGNGEPFRTLTGSGVSFKYSGVFQLVDGSQAILHKNKVLLTPATACGTTSKPGVYEVIASYNGNEVSLSAVPVKLNKFSYVDGICPEGTHSYQQSSATPYVQTAPLSSLSLQSTTPSPTVSPTPAANGFQGEISLCGWLTADCGCGEVAAASSLQSSQQGGVDLMSLLAAGAPLISLFKDMLDKAGDMGGCPPNTNWNKAEDMMKGMKEAMNNDFPGSGAAATTPADGAPTSGQGGQGPGRTGQVGTGQGGQGQGGSGQGLGAGTGTPGAPGLITQNIASVFVAQDSASQRGTRLYLGSSTPLVSQQAASVVGGVSSIFGTGLQSTLGVFVQPPLAGPLRPPDTTHLAEEKTPQPLAALDHADAPVKLNKNYVDARKQTDAACGVGNPGLPDSVSAEDKRIIRTRRGSIDNWVDSNFANKETPTPGRCPRASASSIEASPACELKSIFAMNAELVKNLGEILAELDKCEDKAHDNKAENTLLKFAQKDCDIQAKFEQVNQKVRLEIERAKTACEDTCARDANRLCSVPAFGRCTTVNSCVQACGGAAEAAINNFEEKLGQPDDFSGGALFAKKAAPSSPSTSSSQGVSGQAKKTCAEAVNEEVNRGEDCEMSNKELHGASGVGGLLVEKFGPIKKRTAWQVAYAFGTQSGDADGGKFCRTVCQRKDSFSNLISSGNSQYIGMFRYGLDPSCNPIEPKERDSILGLNINRLPDYLAEHGYRNVADQLRGAVPAPPAGPGNTGRRVTPEDIRRTVASSPSTRGLVDEINNMIRQSALSIGRQIGWQIFQQTHPFLARRAARRTEGRIATRAASEIDRRVQASPQFQAVVNALSPDEVRIRPQDANDFRTGMFRRSLGEGRGIGIDVDPGTGTVALRFADANNQPGAPVSLGGAVQEVPNAFVLRRDAQGNPYYTLTNEGFGAIQGWRDLNNMLTVTPSNGLQPPQTGAAPASGGVTPPVTSAPAAGASSPAAAPAAPQGGFANPFDDRGGGVLALSARRGEFLNSPINDNFGKVPGKQKIEDLLRLAEEGRDEPQCVDDFIAAHVTAATEAAANAVQLSEQAQLSPLAPVATGGVTPQRGSTIASPQQRASADRAAVESALNAQTRAASNGFGGYPVPNGFETLFMNGFSQQSGARFERNGPRSFDLVNSQGRILNAFIQQEQDGLWSFSPQALDVIGPGVLAATIR